MLLLPLETSSRARHRRQVVVEVLHEHVSPYHDNRKSLIKFQVIGRVKFSYKFIAV